MRIDSQILTPELLLKAYAMGVFPMAESREDTEVYWVDPRRRGILPLDGFHMSRSLARKIRQERFHISYDQDFAGVLAGCANRSETWINDVIFQLYLRLHEMGHAHSIEIWEKDDLVGGVYGVALGGAFFGESMFSTRPDTSKIALAYLLDHLSRQGFLLFDTQFITPHLRRLGGIEIARSDYRRRLARALLVRADFRGAGEIPQAQVLLQRITQTS
ncbi:MAG: leucyl/phenylalanyl-tRNA--protein transferase [Mangrovicoccus sp.]|nr:leucyl/phenylalanyl-tRNA--protein transferase [Mangrovicoccus sp.]